MSNLVELLFKEFYKRIDEHREKIVEALLEAERAFERTREKKKLERFLGSKRWVCYGTAVVIDSGSEEEARKRTLEVYLKETRRIRCEEVVRNG